MLPNVIATVQDAANVINQFALDDFQAFALLASVNTTDWLNFINAQKAYERTQKQTVKVNTHTDQTEHDHSTSHSNNPSGSHSDSWGSHTNHTQSTTSYYDDDAAHYNWTGDHTDRHGNATTHIDNGVESGRHYNTHENAYGHANGTSHHQQYEQNTAHTDNTPHSNGYSHLNRTDHDDSEDHDNYGFDHTNYVPSKPVFFDLSENKQVSGLLDICIYSYDKNKDGYGSQTTASKTVKYDLFIRKVKKLDGTADVSSWRTLLSNAAEDPQEGIIYTLDTRNPLGNGLNDGYYEIRAVAKNDPMYGVTFESQAQVITIKIQQNNAPNLTITNKNEVLNFTFGFNGALSPSQVYKRYDQMYAGADSAHREGVFVQIQVIDADANDYQKGIVYLEDASGNKVPGSERDIIWSNGSTVIKSGTSGVTGYGFIPKSVYQSIGYKTGYKIVATVTDYKDAECTQPAGTTATQKAQFSTDTATINFDMVVPTLTADNTDYSWKNKDIVVGFNYSDIGTGVNTVQYAVSRSSTTHAGWQTYSGKLILSMSGEYYIHYRITDKVMNERVGVFGPYKLDKEAPVWEVDEPEPIPYTTRYKIRVRATDDMSGVKRIRLPDGAWVSQSSYEYIAPDTGVYTFIAEDNAGNQAVIDVTIKANPRVSELVMTGLVAKPKGTVLPVYFPVSTPVGIKAGYKMDFQLTVSDTDRVEIRLYKDGNLLPVYVNNIQGDSIVLNTPRQHLAEATFSFWVDKKLPKGTVLDMKIITTRTMSDGTEVSEVSNVNTAIGENFAVIVGSAIEDPDINLTR